MKASPAARSEAEPAAATPRAGRGAALKPPGGVPLASAIPIQAKLTVGAVDDPLEREADRVADLVMRMPAAPGAVAGGLPRASAALRRKCASCARDEEERVRPKSVLPPGHLPAEAVAPPSVAAALAGPGQMLDGPTRAFFEPRFGRALDDVRVHTAAAEARSASAIGGRAYTARNHIVFAPGEFAPGTARGRSLLAHELAHVVQQTGDGRPAAAPTVRRQAAPTPAPAAGASPGETPPPRAELEQPPHGATGQMLPPSSGPAPGVQRLVFSCADMRLRVEAGSVATTYTLETCSLPIGSYEASVKIDGDDFNLKLPQSVLKSQRFDFSYRVRPGQENPATLLTGQASVHVDVVEHMPPPRTVPPVPPQPACVIHMDDRQLVAPGQASRPLFQPLSFDRTVWSHPIPLGEFGFIEVNVNASGGLSGTLSGSYGPGMLTDICLTHQIGSTTSSAPIKHPLLDKRSHADVGSLAVGGRARFRLPASASAGITARGKVKVSGELVARGGAALDGSIDATVEIVALFNRSSATLRAPVIPLEVTISQSSFDKLDLAAQVALRGRASLTFDLDATAALRLARFELWRETWRLRSEAGLGLGWSGGIKYSPNPGIHWITGAIGMLEGIDALVSEDDDDARVDGEDMLDVLLAQASGQVTSPDGLSRAKALPFTWHKPAEIYPARLALPNAQDPTSVGRDEGPMTVRYGQGDRSLYERIGVARRNWPLVGKGFQYIPHEEREEPEKNRLRGLLDRLGYNRAGTDVDHVHELQFGGADAFGNLWPADNSANRSAGSRHRDQLDNYRAQLGVLAGRYFVISRVQI